MNRSTVVVLLLSAIGIPLLLYVALCGFLYLSQDDLLFFRVHNEPRLVDRWRTRRVEIANGNDNIEGWWADGGDAAGKQVILYFGGNAEDVLNTAETARQFNAQRVLVTNYRGYGANAGRPSEQALFSDALAVYDYASKQPGISGDNIVVMGRSLGSGVATYLAANRSVRGVVLVTPYDSMAAVAQAHYPMFPVRWLLKHTFASADRARRISAPALMLAGESDSIVPATHAQRLADVWLGPRQLHVLSGVGHNNIEAHADYYRFINEFLGALPPRR